MPNFGTQSRRNLEGVHPDLVRLFEEVVKHFDCMVLEGYRDADRQEKLYKEGHSRVHYPNSKHNSNPSRAVDVAPYPVNWQDVSRFYYFGGFVKGVALGLGISIKWGGDWNSDTEVRDQRFNDLPHFELR